MKNISENIALFTAPALKNSRKLFLEFWLYIFSNSLESSFKEEIYSKASYLWLWEKFIAEWDEETKWKYVKVDFIGKIEEIWNFEIDFQDSKVTKIIDNKSKNLSNSTLIEFIQRFVEETSYMKDYGISNNFSKKFRFIYAKPEKIIKINENILYPSKSLVSFPLNIDINGKYIESKNIINTIKISENTFLDLKNKELLVKNFSDDLKKWEILLENNLKKVSLWDTNNELYVNIIKILHKNPDGFRVREYEEFKNILDTDFPEKIKAFNIWAFIEYLDFTLNITSSLFIKKKQK